jgi:hypothetical protein
LTCCGGTGDTLRNFSVHEAECTLEYFTITDIIMETYQKLYALLRYTMETYLPEVLRSPHGGLPEVVRLTQVLVHHRNLPEVVRSNQVHHGDLPEVVSPRYSGTGTP